MCLGALRGEHSLKVARSARAVQRLPLMELSQALKAPLVGAGTDYTKCFDLILKAISVPVLDLMGMERGVLNAFHPMYSQLRRKFKIKGCPGA